MDNVLPKPKTYLEFIERGWNNEQAQAIGESSDSKTIEIQEG
jgi:hypothetical protein